MNPRLPVSSSESVLWDVVTDVEKFIEAHMLQEITKRIIYHPAGQEAAYGLGAIGISLKAGQERFEYIGPAYPLEADMIQTMIENLLEEVA